MSFVVVETYVCKKEKLAKLKRALVKFLPILEKIDTILKIEILEDVENSKVLGITTWDSKESFDAFLKSPLMTEILESELMKDIKESALSLDVQMYDTVELNNVKP